MIRVKIKYRLFERTLGLITCIFHEILYNNKENTKYKKFDILEALCMLYDINMLIMYMCLLSMVAVIYLVYKDNKKQLKFSEVLTIIVTILLGFATATQRQHANKALKLQYNLDVASHTPYLIVPLKPLKELTNCEYTKCHSTNQSIEKLESPIERKDKAYVFIRYTKEEDEKGMIRVSFQLENASDIAISYLKPTIESNGNKQECYDPIQYIKESHFYHFKDKNKHKDYIASLHANEYYNIEKNKNIVIDMMFSEDKLQEKAEFENDPNGGYEYPDTLFFKTGLYMNSINGYSYIETIEFGLSKYAYIKNNSKTWCVYEAKKIKSTVTQDEVSQRNKGI